MNPNPPPDGIEALVRLGFTRLEADVYACLLREQAATGYRVAQAIGKPAANTYKAVEALQRKGAVLVDDGGSRVCRAVPPAELLGRLEQSFRETKEQAVTALEALNDSSDDERLYQLSSSTQVMHRACSMLKRAQHIVVMDGSPDIVEQLTSDLEAAAHRGVEVVIKAYRPTDIKNVRALVRPRAHEILDALPGRLISLNIDGIEHLLGLLKSTEDKVFQAVWTASAIIANLLYNGLVSELSQVAVMTELDQPTATVESLREAFIGLRHLHPTTSRGPAYRNLMKRLGMPTARDEPEETMSSER